MPETRGESILSSAGQEHLIDGLDSPSRSRLCAQAVQLDGGYSGGLAAYARKARRLLEAAQCGANPLEGCVPEVPEGERLHFGDERFVCMEERGLAEMRSTVFVLVAGGLGERLGFSGIKVALPTTVVTGTTYLEHFCQGILAYQSGGGGTGAAIPFVIMTSDDTHQKTKDLLEEHSYYGLCLDQVHLLKQTKVPCFADNDARFTTNPGDPALIQTKPHGHGDVHSLLWTSGLAKRFADEGFKWFIFFQDTSIFLFRVCSAALGVSAQRCLAVNMAAVRRRPRDEMGALVRIRRQDGSCRTANVEYNQLAPLLAHVASGGAIAGRLVGGVLGDQFPPPLVQQVLGSESRSTGFSTPQQQRRSGPTPQQPEEDDQRAWIADATGAGNSADASGFLALPGNVNTLVMAMEPYLATLARTSGTIAEFVNPKYADEKRSIFSCAARLESMMQDFAQELAPDAGTVAFTLFDRWSCYSPVKNGLATARARALNGDHPACAASGELDLFAANCRELRLIGADVSPPRRERFGGIDFDVEARVVWTPQWGICHAAIRARLPRPDLIRISQRSAIILDGNVVLESLDLDGALVLRAGRGCKVRVKRLVVQNAGWRLTPCQEDDPDEVTRMRGFFVERLETREEIFTAPGDYLIDEG